MELMRVNRRFLYWGVVLMAIGGVLVVADLTAVDTAMLTDLIRLWPIAIVAIGVSLLARRTRLALPALVAAALIPGLVVGAAFAVAPRFSGDCGAHGDVASVVSDHGAFDGPADVSVRGGCGVLHVSTATGSGWSFEASSTRATSNGPAVDATPTSLLVRAAGNGFDLLDEGRSEWDLVLPTSEINSLKLVVTTGDGQVDLSGARLGDLMLTANAGRAVVDASDAATLQSVSGVVNVGAMSLDLPSSSDFSGSFTVGAGKLDLCTPPDLGLRVDARSTGGSVSVGGLDQFGSAWQSANYDTAPHRADLSVRVTFGAIDINPIGGCNS
jgi:hypothetical protein